jgi:hypothetical protein
LSRTDRRVRCPQRHHTGTNAPTTTGSRPVATPPGKADKPSKKADEEKAAAAAASTEGIVPLAGDTIVFKNGSRLEGVTIARETPVGIEVKVTDADTLMIPRKQIDHIEYGAAGEDTVAAADTGPSILKGQKVSTELFQKLTTAIPDDSLEVKEQDLVEALNAIAKKLGVTIEITDPVKAIPATDREWSTKLEPGATLATYLETGLLGSFPNLKVEFPNDRIVISVSEDAAPAN